MPIIEYQCRDCEHKYEVFYTSQKKREEEEPNEKCEKCDSTKKEALISRSTGFVLKGNWYKQGYKGK
jgi:putative FmdB family regulatory protein